MNHATGTHCPNGHDLTDVGVYVVNSSAQGRTERCRRCHRDSIAESQRRLRAERDHREELLPREVPRFLRKITKDAETGCWNWSGAMHDRGYGIIQIAGRARLAHRVSYRHHKGAFDDELDIDHLCRNRACVNPDHLDAVSHAENMARGDAPNARHIRALMVEGARFEVRKVGPRLIHV